MPDGEIGDRMMWVQSQYPVLLDCPSIEAGDLPPEGLTRRISYQIPLRLKRGAGADIAFGPLGYARHAKASYAVFRALKVEGFIPTTWRFQVGLPAPMDVMPMVELASRPAIEAAYERALLAELAAIEAAVPADELAITWDAVQGVLLWEKPDNDYVTPWFEPKLEGVVERLARLGAATRPGVELGYHLCYGSQDHRHALDPADLGACVRLTNALIAAVPRPIDYVHMPVPANRSDDAYFKPLSKLKTVKMGEVYLGLIHYSDGVEGAKKRMAAAARHLPAFGVATECGFGRRPRHHDIRRLLQLHAEVAG